MKLTNSICRDCIKVRNRFNETSRPIERVLVGLELGACPLSYQSAGSGDTAAVAAVSILPTPLPASVVARRRAAGRYLGWLNGYDRGTAKRLLLVLFDALSADWACRCILQPLLEKMSADLST